MKTNIKDEDTISLVAFVNDLLDICKKYEMEEMFSPYIGEFVRDLRNQGLIVNDKDKK